MDDLTGVFTLEEVSLLYQLFGTIGGVNFIGLSHIVWAILRARVQKVQQFYSNGQKRFEQTWKDGKRDGLEQQWYHNGEKKVEMTWKDDKRDGLEQVWYENGQIYYEAWYKAGKSDGSEQWWGSNGKKWK